MTEQLDFRISSGLKNIIGKELITNDLIAIFELVKNSYDANANKVKIVFENIKADGKDSQPRILIIDDGDGMSYSDINNKWLFVGYSEKKEFESQLDTKDFRDKVGQKRIFAGAKGIGRFSCDKLGRYLKLYTKKEEENVFHFVYTDWGKFEANSKDEFQTIKVEYDRLEDLKIGDYTKNMSSGTVLEIFGLNGKWDRSKLLKLKRYLQRLINPSQVDEKKGFKIQLIADEFQEDDERNRKKGDFEIVNGLIKNVVFEKLGIRTTEINCHIDAEGHKIKTTLIDKGKFLFTIEEKNTYIALQNINISLFYLNPVAKTAFTKTMGLQPVQFGSILLYKNGFRIHPYGDEGDDWLGLEKRKGQGYARFLGTREVIGRIEINGYQPNLREVSSRDGGLEKTHQFDQLLLFFREKALRRLERYVIEGINWDSSASSKSEEDIKLDSLNLISKFAGQIDDPDKKVDFNPELLEIVKEKQVEKLPQLIQNLESLKKSVTDSKELEYIDSQLTALKLSFNELLISTKINEESKKKEVKTLKEKLRKKEKEVLFLESIRGVSEDEIIGLQHHIGLSTNSAKSYMMHMKDRITRGEAIPSSEVLEMIDKVSLEVNKISVVSNFITKANFNLSTASIEKDLVSFIKQYIENVYLPNKKKAARSPKANVQFEIPDELEFIYKFKPLEIMVIFDNLLNNAIKAKASNLKIIMESPEAKTLQIKIKDDGIGIPKENINDIFRFGFTTTGGSGIGLHHVKKIIQKIGGTITVNQDNENGAEFVIVVKK